MDSKDIDVVVIVKTHQGDYMIINKAQAKTDVKKSSQESKKTDYTRDETQDKGSCRP